MASKKKKMIPPVLPEEFRRVECTDGYSRSLHRKKE